jgi:phospholipase C
MISPNLLTDPNSADMPHAHGGYVKSFDNGAVDGFAATEGTQAMGYFDQTVSGVGVFYNYATQNILADHYFSSVLASAPAPGLYLVSAAGNNLPFSTQPEYGPCNLPNAAATWLDQLVKQVQASSIVNDVAIIALWDEGGGRYDHVPPPQIDNQELGIRVPLIVISPLAKKGVVYHGLLDHTSILKFIQWNWGLAPLNARNSDSRIGDMRDMFTF